MMAQVIWINRFNKIKVLENNVSANFVPKLLMHSSMHSFSYFVPIFREGFNIYEPICILAVINNSSILSISCEFPDNPQCCWKRERRLQQFPTKSISTKKSLSSNACFRMNVSNYFKLFFILQYSILSKFIICLLQHRLNKLQILQKISTHYSSNGDEKLVIHAIKSIWTIIQANFTLC